MRKLKTLTYVEWGKGVPKEREVERRREVCEWEGGPGVFIHLRAGKISGQGVSKKHRSGKVSGQGVTETWN